MTGAGVIHCGDSLQVLQTLPENSVDCCVTSPPYYALRDYGADGQIGRDATPEEYIDRLVSVFHEVKRVLTPQGICWVNIADTYCGTGSKAEHFDPKNPKGRNGQQVAVNHRAPGCKPKDLIGIPWLLALALRADGWYLRSSIIWHKANPMPESARDRPTRCYECGFGKLQPFPCSRLYHGRGRFISVCHVYVNAWKPPRPVPIVKLCFKACYQSTRRI